MPKQLCGAVVMGLIGGGTMHEIEALGFTMPYLSKGGWSDFLR